MRGKRDARDDGAIEREVRAEIEAHVDMRVEEGLRRGLTPADARREAAARLGEISAIVAESSRIRRRGSRRRAGLADLRQAWAGLRRSPAWTLSGILVAAAGLCTALSAATIADALLLRPPAVHRPYQLHSVLDSLRGDAPELMSYRTAAAIINGAGDVPFFAWGTRDLQVRFGAAGSIMPAALVTDRYFEVLGIRMAAGRALGPGDARTAARVAVVSERTARRLGLSRDAIGANLTINGQPFQLAGITRAPFSGLDGAHPVDLWLPVEAEPSVSKAQVFPDGRVVRGYISAEIGWMFGGVRLSGSEPPGAVQTRLTGILRGLGRANAPNRRAILQPRIWVPPFSRSRDELWTIARPLWALGLITLLLTAASLASLFGARVAGREPELSVRLALGASRARLLQLCAMEMGMVLAAGAAVGLAICALLLQASGRFQLLPGISVGDAVKDLDARTLLMLAAMTAAIAVMTMAAPLAAVARLKPRAPGLRAATRRSHARVAMMTMQVAAGSALLAGTFMLTQSLWALRAQPLGFDARGVAFVEIDPGAAGLDDAERVALATRASALTGFEALAIADEIPFAGQSRLLATGDGAADRRELIVPVTRFAGPYFDALQVRLLAGRALEAADASRRVTVISESLARRWWTAESAVGRAVRVGGPRGTVYQVVGVVPDLRDLSLRGARGWRMYLPFGADTEQLTVIARARNEQQAAALLQQVHALDPRIAAGRSGRLEHLIERTLEQRILLRAFTAIVGAGSLALVLAGVWGLSHDTVVRRWREIGIRLALGASNRSTLRVVYRDALIVAVAGGAGGILAGYQLGRLLSSMLFEVRPGSMRILLAASAIVMATAIAAAVPPARRALRFDPASLLRSQ